MVDTTLSPLLLQPFRPSDATRVLSGDVDPHDGWEGGYSFIEEPEVLSEYLAAITESGDPAPFGPYIVRRSASGQAIGGVNLFGPIGDDGAVEFAFGLVPAVQGQGLAAHVIDATVELARASGATIARAVADLENLPARHALLRAGLSETSRTDDVITFEIHL